MATPPESGPYDYAVIGAGIVGLSIARELRHRNPDARILVLEKERAVAEHASGRNSGVLHAGFYYSPDSLKARLSRDGNQALTAFCQERGLPINRCGKLVVARDEDDLPRLDELERRARRNGVPLERMTPQEARRVEPRVRTHEAALYSPTTSTIDPVAVMEALRADVEASGVEIRTGATYRARRRDGIETSTGTVPCRFVINAAGLHADRIARDYGFSQSHAILPFRGHYLASDEPPGWLRCHVYPPPDLENPFLGVHLTVGVDGHVKIGPNALPVLWREAYSGLEGFRPREFLDVAWRGARLFVAGPPEIRRLARQELLKGSRRGLVRRAADLVEGIRPANHWRWGRPGIRAQLVDLRAQRLEMDFVLEGDEDSLHVLNAVSPGFTCAFPFAAHVVDEVERRTQRGTRRTPVG